MPQRTASVLLMVVLALEVCALEPASALADEGAKRAPVGPDDAVWFEQHIRPLLIKRCFECHGALQQKGGLRLDSRQAILEGNDAGPAVVPGDPMASRLVEVISYDDVIRMPPQARLPDSEIELLVEWVRRGAPFPGDGPRAHDPASPEGIARARQSHWAFQPIGRPTLPRVKNPGWAATPVDAFILAALEERGLQPSRPADRHTLLRRVTYDLIGLPPSEADIADFEGDERPDSLSRLVDRLLASPRYGERWGRHWLDVARYADTKGYVFTEERKYPFSYTYRDYVVRAFNQDLPYDRFVLEQLAADRLGDAADPAALAGMGFLTLGRRFGNNVHDIIDDRIDVVSRGFLGLTVGCARCHDHKYDPIPIEDYYSLYGIFAGSVEPEDLPLIGEVTESREYAVYSAELERRNRALRDFVSGKHAELVDSLREQTGAYLAAALKDEPRSRRRRGGMSLGPRDLRPELVERWKTWLAQRAGVPDPVFGPWHALRALPAEGFPEQAAAILAQHDPARPVNGLLKEALAKASPKSMPDVAAAYGSLFADIRGRWLKFQTEQDASGMRAQSLPDPAAEELRQVLYSENAPPNVALDEARRFFDRATRNKANELRREVESWKANSPAAPPRAMVLYDAPAPTVQRVFQRGDPNRAGGEVPRRFLQALSAPGAPGFGPGSGRLELAKAIASGENPLTARVIVNRLWLHHFGRGIVSTPSDFGARGSPPSHPELLDFLARALVEGGWSIKTMHRLIVLSSVYQQASDENERARQTDPENRLLWKMNRRRLEFEAMRDALLATAGRLDPAVGGRPVDLFSPPFVQRRAVYGYVDRQDLPGTLRVFDFASPDVSTAQRPQTTVPQQALFAMNAAFLVEQAQATAARPEVVDAGNVRERVQALYRLVYGRPADEFEVSQAVGFLEAAGDSEQVGSDVHSPDVLTPFEQLAQVLLMANEFVYVD